jgi:PAS domain S-box-containing protein
MHEILESITDAFYAVDHQWRFTYVNRRAEQLWRRSREELIGNVLWEVFPQTAGTELEAALKQAAGDRVSLELETFSPLLGIWVHAHIYPSGEGLSVYFHDVTEKKKTDKALRESNERYELIARAVHEVIWEWNLGDDLVVWSEAIRNVLGYDPVTLARDNENGYRWWISKIHPDDRDRVLQRYEAILAAGGREWSEEYRFQRADGSYAVLLDRAHIVRDAEGRMSRVLGAMIDVTEQRETEAQRRAQQEQLLVALEAGRLGSWQLDLDTGQFDCSDGFKANFGWTSGEEFTYERMLERIHPDDRRTRQDALDRAIAAGSGYECDYRVTWDDGTIHWLTSRGRASSDADGKVRRIIGVTQEVTEIRRNQEAQRFLAEAGMLLNSSLDYEKTLSSLLRLAVPLLADYCILDIVTESGEIERAGVAYADPATEMAIRPLLDQHVPSIQREDHPIASVIRSGMASFVPEVAPDWMAAGALSDEQLESAQRLRTLALFSIPLTAQGRVIGAITFCSTDPSRRYDVSDVALAEEFCRRAALAVENARLYREVQQTSRAKDEFLAVLSHELRTPMTVTLGWAGMLRSGGLSGDQVNLAIESLEESTRAQARIINDILDVSRVVTGKLRLNVERVELDVLIRNAIDSIRPAATAKGIELAVEMEPVRGQLHGDSGRLQQILWNLLFNAVKFTPRGGRVSLEVRNGGDDLVELIVADNGMGIAPEFLPYVFDRFRQANSGTNREHGGLGLGLSIVRNLTELHGGTVRAESYGEGHGSRFVVRLPIDNSIQTPSPRIDTARDSDLHGLRLLVVDDDRPTAEMIRAALEKAGAEVTAVGSAASALDSLIANEYALMVSDIGMPLQDGYELIRRIRSGDGPAQTLPAIALTAYARPQDCSAALNAGFDAYLAKPVEPERLAREILRVVGTRRSL